MVIDQPNALYRGQIEKSVISPKFSIYNDMTQVINYLLKWRIKIKISNPPIQ